MPVNLTYSNDLFPSRDTLHLLNEKYYSTLCQNWKFSQTASHLSDYFRLGGMEKIKLPLPAKPVQQEKSQCEQK